MALMFAAKWRAEHPTATKEDLKMRTLMSESSEIVVVYEPGLIWKGDRYIRAKGGTKSYRLKQSEAKLKSLIDTFHLSPQPHEGNLRVVSEKGTVYVHFSFSKERKDGVARVTSSVETGSFEGDIASSDKEYNEVTHELHPITIKRWKELLLDHPNIGPELRARLNR